MTDFIVGDRVRRNSDNAVGTVIARSASGIVLDVQLDGRGKTAGATVAFTRLAPDWSEPLEAYHPDGWGVAVEKIDTGNYCIKPNAAVDDGANWSFGADGTHPVSQWRIRNRVQPEWGDPIRKGSDAWPDDQERPVWLGDDEIGLNKDGVEVEAVCWMGVFSPYRLRSNHPAYVAIGQGFVPWGGGERAPDDWDGGEVLTRNGHTIAPDGPSDNLSWTHPHAAAKRNPSPGDIIGYRRRAAAPIPTLTEQAVRDAVGDGADAVLSLLRDAGVLSVPAVDPLLLRAREIVADAVEASEMVSTAHRIRSGERDDTPIIQAVLTALRERDA